MPLRKRTKTRSVDSEQASDPQAVRAAAVTLLARRDFASGELHEKLLSQGYERALVDEAVAELVEGRVLNDARYAEHFVAYHADRGQGPVRIAQELKTLGLPPDLIDAALESGPDWRARAREVRIRKFGLEPPDTWAEKGRQARFLQYRGFSADHIRSAIGPDFDPDEPS
jgi:regulatory protein